MNKKQNQSAEFSHLNHRGEAHMVDVSDKSVTSRSAQARARIVLGQEVLDLAISNQLQKGDLIATARIAGIQAAKKCSDLIPLCHPLSITKVAIDIEAYGEDEEIGLEITALCRTDGKTGVEMEALTASAVTALTIYDMCKALDKGIVIKEICLTEKVGGKSGHWQRDD